MWKVGLMGCSELQKKKDLNVSKLNAFGREQFSKDVGKKTLFGQHLRNINKLEISVWNLKMQMNKTKQELD